MSVGATTNPHEDLPQNAAFGRSHYFVIDKGLNFHLIFASEIKMNWFRGESCHMIYRYHCLDKVFSNVGTTYRITPAKSEP